MYIFLKKTHRVELVLGQPAAALRIQCLALDVHIARRSVRRRLGKVHERDHKRAPVDAEAAAAQAVADLLDLGVGREFDFFCRKMIGKGGRRSKKRKRNRKRQENKRKRQVKKEIKKERKKKTTKTSKTEASFLPEL